MVKVRCPKCGTIFPPEAREVQICPNCGCVMRVTRRSAAKRYITDRRDDGYRPQQPPRLPERSGGVYLSREEYEDLLYKARARREHRADRGYYDGYAEDYTGIAPPEYDTPREVYDYRRDRGYPPAGRAPEPAPQPAPQQEQTPQPQPAEPAPVQQPAEEQPAPVYESAPQPEQAPCDTFACDPAAPRPFGSSVYDGPDYGRPPVDAPAPASDIFRSAPVPSAQTAVAPMPVLEPAPKGSATVRNVPATVLTVLVLIAAGVFSGLLLALGVSGSGEFAVSGMDIVSSELYGVAEKVITIALIAVPVLVALLGIVGALAKSKPLMIVMGVLGILAGAALLLFDLLIALPTTGFDGFVDQLTSNFKSNSVWVYIAAGVTLLGAILCIVTAALTKKKPNVQKIM